MNPVILNRWSLRIEEWLIDIGYQPPRRPLLGEVGARVLTKNGKAGVFIDGILISSLSNENEQIDNYFNRLKKSLQRTLLKHPETEVFFRGGGTIPVPEWFRDWCNQNGIKIHIVGENGENLPEMVGGEPAPWMPQPVPKAEQELINKYTKKQK